MFTAMVVALVQLLRFAEDHVLTWKEACFLCLRAGEFQLAATFGLEVIKYPDHLDEVVALYVHLGHFEHVISLLEQGTGMDDAHTGIFTELALLYTLHSSPEKVMDHCKVFFTKLDVSKVAYACELAYMFQPVVYLYNRDGQHDKAIETMFERASAWHEDLFLDSVTKVVNAKLVYKAIGYYLTTYPTLFTRLMQVMEETVDHSRVVSQLRRTGDWAPQLGQYITLVQKLNMSAVNEALNEFYQEEEDCDSLRKSIDSFKNFSMIALPEEIRNWKGAHNLLEFRRILAFVLRCDKKYKQSIELSKKDRMWKDCIATAKESAEEEIVEGLLRFFCEKGVKEGFCATLYTCYPYVTTWLNLELAGTYGYKSLSLPFECQRAKDEACFPVTSSAPPRPTPSSPSSRNEPISSVCQVGLVVQQRSFQIRSVQRLGRDTTPMATGRVGGSDNSVQRVRLFQDGSATSAASGSSNEDSEWP